MVSLLNGIQSITAEAHSSGAWCNLMMPTSKQYVESCSSALTVMTDTPAVVLLSLGPVLKCFLIFPATDSWYLFSDTPSSWKIQTKLHHLNLLHIRSALLHAQVILVKGPALKCWTHIDPGVIEHLHSCVSLIYLHLQHPGDQSLQKHDVLAASIQRSRSLTDSGVSHGVYPWPTRRELPDTNLGRVRHIVPVWCGEIKQAPQNLFKKSLLIFTTAAQQNNTYLRKFPL